MPPPPPLRLRHIHLPPSARTGAYPPYRLATTIQSSLRRALLASKATGQTAPSPAQPLPPLRPPPTLLSFTPSPTYTLGRRQSRPSSDHPLDLARLRAPLTISSPPAASADEKAATYTPAVIRSPRGGLATYHGPGQVVLWPVVDLHSPTGPAAHRRFDVRGFVRALENTTVALLRARFGVRGHTEGEPGVWVAQRGKRNGEDGDRHERAGGQGQAAGIPARKIAAVGVHLRRHVSGLGTAVNIDMPSTPGGEPRAEADGGLLGWLGGADAPVPDEATNPWARFVPCGLPGRGVTSVRAEWELGSPAGWRGDGAEALLADTAGAAGAWAGLFARELRLGGGDGDGDGDRGGDGRGLVEVVPGDVVGRIVERALEVMGREDEERVVEEAFDDYVVAELGEWVMESLESWGPH